MNINLISLVLASLLLHSVKGETLEANYDRIVDFAKDKDMLTIPSFLIYIDQNNTRTKTLYTDAQVELLKVDSKQWMIEYFGINVTANAIYNPTYDAFIGPYGMYAPLDIGRDDYADKLIYDKDHPSRGILSWIRSFSGYGFLFQSTGTFPSGMFSGYLYNAGDLLTYGYLDMLRNNSNWEKPASRENLHCYSLMPARSFTNMYNITTKDSVFVWQCIDDNGNFCVAVITTVYFRKPDGSFHETKRTSLTCDE